MTDASSPQYSSGTAEAIRTATLWFEQQIENAEQDQKCGFFAGTAAGTLRGERAHARNCAMYEAQQVFLAAISPQAQAGETNTDAEPSRCKNPVARGESMETDALTGDAPVASVSTLHAVAQGCAKCGAPITDALHSAGFCGTAQGQSDGDDDPYITDLKFAIEQNIKAARKYKARLDFMEVKYGAIDWDGTASPPAALPAGEAEGIQWRRVNDEPYEYAVQQGPHGDEFVKLLNGSCLCRTLVIPSTALGSAAK